MVIDWHEMSLLPAVRRLGEVLRETFRVWVGFVGPDGSQVAIGEGAGLDKPVCRAFMSQSIELGDDGELFSCARSVAEWSSADAGAREATCHAGLSALVVPIETPGGHHLGDIYISGWVPAESASTSMRAVRERLGYLELREDLDDEQIDRVPRLTRPEREFMGAMADGLVDEVLEHVELPESRSEDDDRQEHRFCGMLGRTPPMLRLFRQIEKIADGSSTVLVLGENGTGKELVARAIHRKSRRKHRPLVVQNVAAIPGDLVESELFGHVKGAFSGAHRTRKGLFEVANGGTFFLDEIGEMDLSLQVKLLRVLQEGTFLPVGDTVFRKVDVRVICATNRDLRKMVEEGTFREDLYYRINVISLHVPPLRRHRRDIPLLVDHFLSRASKAHGRPPKRLSDAGLEKLMAYDWPGNIRELENEIERMVIMSGDETVIGIDHLSPKLGGVESTFESLVEPGEQLPDVIERIERQMILDGLRRTGWNKSQTARDLGVSRRNLIRKVASYGLDELRPDG
jgi:DNA-binding NtrC family response regulator